MCRLTRCGERRGSRGWVGLWRYRFPSKARPLCLICTDKPTGYGSSSRRAPQTGIVDECCFRSCDLRRLEMYCAPLKPAKSARSVRAQRHTDMPKAQKVSQQVGRDPTSSRDWSILCLWVGQTETMSHSLLVYRSKKHHSPLKCPSLWSLHIADSVLWMIWYQKTMENSH